MHWARCWEQWRAQGQELLVQSSNNAFTVGIFLLYTEAGPLKPHTPKNSIILISLDDDYEIDKKIIKGYCLPGKKGNCWNAYKIEIHVLFPLKNIAFMTQSEPHWNICMYLSTQKISLFKIINSQTEAWNVVFFFLNCYNAQISFLLFLYIILKFLQPTNLKDI